MPSAPVTCSPAAPALTVEIGNTDAEGRLVLADALALADVDAPDLLFTFATLTGAARVALGPELPALFSTDDALAQTLATTGLALADPSWRLPFWPGYDRLLDSDIADVNHISDGPIAGAVTAALFLKRFVKKAQPLRPSRHVRLDRKPAARPAQGRRDADGARPLRGHPRRGGGACPRQARVSFPAKCGHPSADPPFSPPVRGAPMQFGPTEHSDMIAPRHGRCELRGTPSPLKGEGWGGGERLGEVAAIAIRLQALRSPVFLEKFSPSTSPPPCPSPSRGEGTTRLGSCFSDRDRARSGAP